MIDADNVLAQVRAEFQKELIALQVRTGNGVRHRRDYWQLVGRIEQTQRMLTFIQEKIRAANGGNDGDDEN